jgi:uncharacterized protein (DUF2147 family)
MLEEEGTLTDGTILDPKTGKIYNCNISLEKDIDKLKVRGSIDKGGFIGRTQIWQRVK